MLVFMKEFESRLTFYVQLERLFSSGY